MSVLINLTEVRTYTFGDYEVPVRVALDPALDIEPLTRDAVSAYTDAVSFFYGEVPAFDRYASAQSLIRLADKKTVIFVKEDRATILERHQQAMQGQSPKPAFEQAAAAGGDTEVYWEDGSYLMHGRYYVSGSRVTHRLDI